MSSKPFDLPLLWVYLIPGVGTCIHGGPFHGATVGPHAINQGATFDTVLVEAMSNATADEMRANSIQYYNSSNGQEIVSLSCDGGPLANSAHDPRW